MVYRSRPGAVGSDLSLAAVSFAVENLVEAPHVAVLGNEFGGEKRLDDLPRQRGADNPCGKGNDVDVVVLDGLVSGVGVVGLSAADSVEFVGGDGGTCPGTEDNDAAVGLSVDHGPANRCGVVGVVDRLGRVGAA